MKSLLLVSTSFRNASGHCRRSCSERTASKCPTRKYLISSSSGIGRSLNSFPRHTLSPRELVSESGCTSPERYLFWSQDVQRGCCTLTEALERFQKSFGDTTISVMCLPDSSR